MADEVKDLIKDLKSKLKISGVRTGSDEHPLEYISTGNKALDLALEGGIAWGYVCEWLGKSASGKTLLLQQLLADAQKKYDAIGVWFDRENAFFKKRAEELGINTDNVILVEPQEIVTVADCEQITKEILSKIPSDRYKFIAIDSISAFAKEGDKADMGKKAQALHNFFRTIIPMMDERTSLSFTNQVTFKIGVLFGPNETTTGGEGPKYYSTYRLKLDNRKAIKNENDVVLGNWIKTVVIKTRLGPAFREVEFPFYYKEGIPYYGGLARMLVRAGILRPKNKQKFTSFSSTTLLYGDEEVDEFEIEEFLKRHEEIKVDRYPS